MKQGYFGDIIVIERRRLKVAYDYEGKLTKEKLAEALRNNEIEDIIDEETIDIVEVETIGGSE